MIAKHYSYLLCGWLPGHSGVVLQWSLEKRMGPARDMSVHNSASNSCIQHGSREEGASQRSTSDASPLLGLRGSVLSVLCPRTHA